MNNTSEAIVGVDVPEGIPMENFVFDDEGNERRSWRFCFSTRLPRSEVVYFSQMFFILFLMLMCLYKLLFIEVRCEEMSFWVSLLSSLVGYILPNPKL